MDTPLVDKSPNDNNPPEETGLAHYLIKRLPYQLSLVNTCLALLLGYRLYSRRPVFDVYLAYPVDYAFSELVTFYIHRQSLLLADLLCLVQAIFLILVGGFLLV